MRIDWSTLALQTVNLLVLLWLLRRYLFRPVANMIAARRQAAAAMLSEAAATRTAAQATADDLAHREHDLAADTQRLRAEAEAGAEADRARLLAAAEADIARIRAEAATSIWRERAVTRQTLEAEARRLALAIAARLLERIPGEAATAAMLDSLGPALVALPAEQRHALAAPLDVVSAAALSEAQQAACAATLARVLNPPPPLRFRVDPALIAGIELHGAHVALRHSWQAELERIAHELSLDDADVEPVLA
jgi:F-type H+-transporting ATPase subunit b